MKGWVVTVGVRVEDMKNHGDGPGRLLEALAPLGGAVSHTPDCWVATVTLNADDWWIALVKGKRKIMEAAILADLADTLAEVIEIEVISEDDRNERLGRQLKFPDVVDLTETAAILGITKQRIHQLRKDERFPQPMVELTIGPLWMRAAIEQFANVARPAGRPSKAEP